ncbi:4-fold beta flower protein [Bradyrhizobium sp. CCBAU 11430]|uniref:4-fold beta flower protein n=1 Tax=Bradyrhizobium sp. CCBAU 11430 TaxID=1630881 RepID=UPI00230626F6|nr:hypothetical protein [Bradyrhizobium sp. CCBAU 11430]
MAWDFHDRHGNATHYVGEKGTFYTWDGDAIGFLQGEELYDNSGRHVGRISDGWINAAAATPSPKCEKHQMTVRGRRSWRPLSLDRCQTGADLLDP